MEEIRGKMFQAKTVEELLAIATEAGEPLTTEDATKLLQELEAERAMAKHGLASAAEDLTDEELAKVSGGELGPMAECSSDQERAFAMEMTYRSGNDVYINFGAAKNNQFCGFWRCGEDGDVFCAKGGFMCCLHCKKTALCKECSFRVKRGGIANHDICSCTDVRMLWGLK